MKKTSPTTHPQYPPQRSSPFSNNLIQIININSNNISNTSPIKKPVPPETYRYYDLINKLDQIIEESRKTQEMIKEKQRKIEPPNSFKENYDSSYMNEIGRILNEIEIPNELQSEIITNLALKRICQQNIYASQADVMSPNVRKSHEKAEIKPNEENLRFKIEKIRQKSGFDMMKFIENLYDLAVKAQLDDESPYGKSTNKMNKMKKLGFEDCMLNIEEDYEWKKLTGEENLMFYKEMVIENIEPKYFSWQAMNTEYERMVGVYMNMKAKKEG